ncbi:hypothetical protein [Acinetobacter baumannii]|uniref:hypothetical protein n=1 Tax=Acinetobacter baumannii TaxID=470 RepID=UPI001A9140EE|nr:hypothetical protein [Acinetobacter baumannii]MBO0660863.1 hypothetical protein [Acinetobacter baumannii]
MEKENSILDIFWKSLTISIVVGIVLICVTYLIADYPAKLSSKVVNISFIKDIYSIIFAIFAPFIAIYLFNDWKEQHNKTVVSNEAQKTLKIFNELSNLTGDLDYAYDNIKTPEYIVFTESKNLKNGVKEVFDNTEKALNHYTHFNALSENEDGINLFMEMYSVLKDYKEFIYKSENNYISNIVNIDSEFRDRLYAANEKIREHLKTFIFVK